MTGPDAAPASTGTLIRRLARGYLRPYRLTLLGAIGCMVVAAAYQPLLAWLMDPVVQDVFVNHDADTLTLITFAVVAIMVFGGLANFGQSVLMSWVGLRVVADLQHNVFRHVIALDLAFFHRTASGKLIANFTSDANLVRQATASTLTGLVKDLLSVTLFVGVMFYEYWDLAIMVLFVFPLAGYPIARLGRRMRRVVTNTQAEIGEFSSLLNETFQGARHVKAYGMEGYEAGRAKRIIDRLFTLYLRSAKTRALATPTMELLGGVSLALVLYYGGSQVIAGTSEPGRFFAFLTALLMAYRPLRSVANLNTVLQEGLAASQRLFNILDEAPGITDRPGAKRLEVDGGAVRFEGVGFAYGDDAPALAGLDLEVGAGKTVALVGPSGAGKSTIFNLIPRFYDVTAGRVSINGQDVREVSLASLRAAIALVSQEITLFNDTVRANIAYGKPGADQADIEAAARAAAAHDFITELSDGYDTVVGERGVKLSGGERQRIAIARAMLKDAPILLLDEATASLDTESERRVQAALEVLKKGRTTLVIAHRLSTVRDADLIYVIEAGSVAEQGSHETLIAADGTYARLHRAQFSAGIDLAPEPAAIAGGA